jgi:tight adherence protein B
MNIMELDAIHLFYVSAAIAVVLLVEALYLIFYKQSDYRSQVNRRLKVSLEQPDREKVLIQLRRERGLSQEGGGLIPWVVLQQLVMQSGMPFHPWKLAGGVVLIGLVVFGGLFFWKGNPLLAASGAGGGMLVLPVLILKFLRARRLNTFGEQFPEALDVIVRSLRAGHPVPTAITMVGREMPDPVGTEFGMASDEIAYGTDLETAMRAMAIRVGHEDLPLFVTSVAIQSSTGGNLSQILENLSKVIRERFKMRRKIRGLSSEGRSSAMILNLAPIIVFTMVQVISPEFYGETWNHPLTMKILGVCVVWMMVGNLIMRKMINFKF